MSRKVSPLLPSTLESLRQFGLSLRLARLRRRLSAKQVAQRAGMSPITLRHVEQGADGVTMGAYLAAMQVLGLEQELLVLAQNDSFGHELQDAKLLRSAAARRHTGHTTTKQPVRSRDDSHQRTHATADSEPGFTTVEDLAALIAPVRQKSG